MVVGGQAIGFGISVALNPIAGLHWYREPLPNPCNCTHSPSQIAKSGPASANGNLLTFIFCTFLSSQPPSLIDKLIVLPPGVGH